MTAVLAAVNQARSERGRRQRRVALVLLALVVAVALTALSVGAYVVPLPNLLRALVGAGEPRDELVVLTLRLPRILLGMLAGMSFAVAGGQIGRASCRERVFTAV